MHLVSSDSPLAFEGLVSKPKVDTHGGLAVPIHR